MAQNFIDCDREQELLLPPSLSEWLPEDHLAWFVLDAVDQIDLIDFYGSYREDGWGRAAFDPKMMLALLLYAYAVGERSSRAIERRLREDVAFRVIAANQTPDHATIARFRARHERALSNLFTEILRLCAEAGLASVGTIAVDGTKVAAAASPRANRSYESISAEVEEILAQASDADQGEDALHGVDRGDELPAELAAPQSRRARLAAAKARLDAELDAERDAHEEHLRRREALEAERGRPLRGRKPKPPAEAVDPKAKANTTDPDSRFVRSPKGFVQGYNAQAAANEHQVIVAAELSGDSPDSRLLEPTVEAARAELASIGVPATPGVVLADGGYWNVPQIERLVARGSELLVNPDSSARPARQEASRKLRDKRVHGLYGHMQRSLATPRGEGLYRRRQQMVEPVFAQIKVIRRAERFQRRGASACRSEWRLLAATHNLLKLWRLGPAGAGA